MSNLLDKASIILTPTAYNNGEALCVKPSDGSGDFDFSRNSAATRVNAQGLVENVQILSSNLVQNGDFSEEGAEEVSNGSFSQEGIEVISAASWSNQTSGTATISNGIITFANGTGYLTQSGISANTFYKFVVTLSNVTQGSFRITTEGSVNTETLSTNGVHEFYLQSTSAGGVFIIPLSNFTGSIDNVSVREVGQDWTLGTGWSIGEDKAVADGTTNNAISQTTISSVVGKSYKIDFTIDDYVTGNIRIYFGGVFTPFVNSNGVYSFYIAATAVDALATSASGLFNGSITNISVKEVGMDWETNDANITIQGGYASFNSPNTYTRLTNTPTTNIIQGKTYKAKCTVSNYVSGICYFRMPFNNASGSNRITSNGEYEFISVADNNYSNIVIAAASSNAVMDITNISVIEITDDTNLPRINYEGFSYQDVLGSEQIVNGDFSDGSANWSLSTGWSVVDSKLYSDNTQASFNSARQLNVTEIGKTYKLKFDLNLVSGIVEAKGSGLYGQYYPSNNGEVTLLFIADSTQFRFTNFPNNTLGTIDNVSVKEYLGQEVVPDSGCGSWLWEPQTTQIVSYSELFSNAYWGNFNVGTTPILETGFLAPDGTNNAFKISNANQDSFWYAITGGFNATTTRSIYARTVSGTGTAQLCSHNSNTNNTFTITEQWQRFELNATASTTGQEYFYAVDFRGGTTLSEIILWGANATNDQDYATSYIPSNGTTVTRNQDVCNNGGSLATINSTEGVLYAEIAALANDLSFRSIALSDGTVNNRILILYTDASNGIRVLVFRNNALQVILNNTINITDVNKVAVRYKFNNVTFWVNGVKLSTDTNASMPIGLNQLSFSRGDGDLPFFGKTKCLAVFPYLTDAELTELTTI